MIELRDITRRYRGGSSDVRALDGVNLVIGAGEYVAIIGPSGSGKSTMLHVLGFLDRPDGGVYRFQGADTTDLTDLARARLRNRHIGFVFQQFHLLPRFTALENVQLPMTYAGRGSTVERARHCLESVGLADRVRHRPNELSGGEQQRVAIARALVNDPVVLMADEPTGNLDSRTEMEIVGVLEGLHAAGLTLVVVTHEKEIAARAHRLIAMRDGRIVSDEGRGARSTVTVPTGAPRTVQAMESPGIFSHVRQAVRSLRAHKTRAFLSMLGVLIGVGAVIAMTAVTGGARDALRTQLMSMGSNLLMVFPGTRQVYGVALEHGTVTRLKLEDVQALAELPSVKSVSANVRGRGQIVWGGRNRNTQVLGVEPAYVNIRASQPVFGRFFTEEEYASRALVALVGPTVLLELFEGVNPVGESIRINRIPFTIVGVLPSKGGQQWGDMDDIIVIPLSTAMYRLMGKQYVDYVDVEVRSEAMMEQAKLEIPEQVARRYRTAGNTEDLVRIRDMTEIQSAISKTSQTMEILLGIIAGISLLVGGIGIMNIMLVSVRERTREIGLRKAVGASGRDILLQFLVEAVTLTVSGGLLGFLLGVVAAVILSHTAEWPIRITAGSAILAMGFSVAVGLVFGIWPARQASRLDPIDALRYE